MTYLSDAILESILLHIINDSVGSLYFYSIQRISFFLCRTCNYEPEDAHTRVKSLYLLSYPLAGLPLFTVFRLICWLIHALCSVVTPPLLQRHCRTEHSFIWSGLTSPPLMDEGSLCKCGCFSVLKHKLEICHHQFWEKTTFDWQDRCESAV